MDEIDNMVALASNGNKALAKKPFELSDRGKELLPLKTLTKKELDKFREKVLREYTPEALVTLMEGLMGKIKLGDTQAMQLMSRVIKLIEDGPMVAIQNNQTNYNGGGRKPNRRFEDMVAGPQEARMKQVGGGRQTVIDVKAD